MMEIAVSKKESAQIVRSERFLSSDRGIQRTFVESFVLKSFSDY